jgi:hypothetical protein
MMMTSNPALAKQARLRGYNNDELFDAYLNDLTLRQLSSVYISDTKDLLFKFKKHLKKDKPDDLFLGKACSTTACIPALRYNSTTKTAPPQGVTASSSPPVRMTPRELRFRIAFTSWVKAYYNLASFASESLLTDQGIYLSIDNSSILCYYKTQVTIFLTNLTTS